MSKGRFNIMVIPPSTGRVKQYSLPQWVGSVAITVGAVFLTILLVAVGLAVYGLSNAHKYSDQCAEGEALRASLSEMEADVTKLRQRLADLEEMEKSVRMVFGFPEIDPSERELGIGGGLPIAEGPRQATLVLETEIDRLLRRCAYERENYGEVLNGLVDRKDQFDHTPSLFPSDGYLSRGFGMKPNPFTGRERMHRGIDLAGRIGMPVYATADGRVSARKTQRELGRMLVVDHGYGLETYYGHLSKYAVAVNDRVKRGDILGYMGNSGNSTGPHLHYEVHVNGRAVNPMNYVYDKAPTESEPLAAKE
ncbi:MAG TPA: M23 family metallopeptidase [Acidobacteriota bacterium]|nr:M23 family metallopeptidase [Acidobacteriota bacterium]